MNRKTRSPISQVRKAKLYERMFERIRSASIIMDNKMASEVIQDYISLARSGDGEHSELELRQRYSKSFKSLEGKYKV